MGDHFFEDNSVRFGLIWLWVRVGFCSVVASPCFDFASFVTAVFFLLLLLLLPCSCRGSFCFIFSWFYDAPSCSGKNVTGNHTYVYIYMYLSGARKGEKKSCRTRPALRLSFISVLPYFRAMRLFPYLILGSQYKCTSFLLPVLLVQCDGCHLIFTLFYFFRLRSRLQISSASRIRLLGRRPPPDRPICRPVRCCFIVRFSFGFV